MSGDNEIVEAIDHRLGEVSTQQVVEAAELQWPESFWSALARDGFTSIGLAETEGGSGGDVRDGCGVLRVVGRHAAPGPWAESGMLLGFLSRHLGDVKLGDGVTTIAERLATATEAHDGKISLSGAIRGVPWARVADRVVVIVQGDRQAGLVVIPRAQYDVEEATNVAGEARDVVRPHPQVFHQFTPLDADQVEEFRALGALSRSALISGAIARMLDMTVTYCKQREQFGRPISAFQLVQRHIVTLAEQAALVTAAVDAAAVAASDGRGGLPEMVAAKLIANSAAAEAARVAHQAHGAIGVTREYRLHQFTRRLWSWRSEYGTSTEWSAWLGQRVVDAGDAALYPLITDPSLQLS